MQRASVSHRTSRKSQGPRRCVRHLLSGAAATAPRRQPTCLHSALWRSHRNSIAHTALLSAPQGHWEHRQAAFGGGSLTDGLPHAAAVHGAMRQAIAAAGAPGKAGTPPLLGARARPRSPGRSQSLAPHPQHWQYAPISIAAACRPAGARLWCRRQPPPPSAAAAGWHPSPRLRLKW